MEQKKLENCLLFLFISKSCAVLSVPYTAKNTAISARFLVWKFCGKAQFPHSFRRFAFPQKTVPFRKISTPGNQVKLRYFWQWCVHIKHVIFLKFSSNSTLDLTGQWTIGYRSMVLLAIAFNGTGFYKQNRRLKRACL